MGNLGRTEGTVARWKARSASSIVFASALLLAGAFILGCASVKTVGGCYYLDDFPSDRNLVCSPTKPTQTQGAAAAYDVCVYRYMERWYLEAVRAVTGGGKVPALTDPDVIGQQCAAKLAKLTDLQLQLHDARAELKKRDETILEVIKKLAEKPISAQADAKADSTSDTRADSSHHSRKPAH